MSVPRIIVHTDVFLDHLRGPRLPDQPSVLRRVMGMFFCYATVFQAIELFSLARSDNERRAIEDSMGAMKLLGLNPKNAGLYGRLLASTKSANILDILIAGLCMESKLPLLTDRASAFRKVRGLVVVPTKLVARYNSAAEVLQNV